MTAPLSGKPKRIFGQKNAAGFPAALHIKVFNQAQRLTLMKKLTASTGSVQNTM